MSKRQIPSLSCFASSKIDRGTNFSCMNTIKKPISKSLHDNINYLDSSSLHSSNSSGQHVSTARPMPPPYDEYTGQKYGIGRSHSTYSACNSSSLSRDTRVDRINGNYVQDDQFSQYSDGDPPRLTDHLSTATISRHCVRPITLRPITPPNKHSGSRPPAFVSTKGAVDCQQSPSGDSGVRLTPSELEPICRSRDSELHNYLSSHAGSASDSDRLEELKLLRLVNNKLTLNEHSNQHLITKATHLIGKLRQKLKDKDFEIGNLQNKLRENTEKLRSKEKLCKELEIEIQQSCHVSNNKSSNFNVKDASTQTLLSSDHDTMTVYFRSMSDRFEEERAKWLDEKSLVISYHKQLNDNYQNLLQKNAHLERELIRLQGNYITDAEYSSETYVDTDISESRGDIIEDINTTSHTSNNRSQSVSRLVKFEESLC